MTTGGKRTAQWRDADDEDNFDTPHAEFFLGAKCADGGRYVAVDTNAAADRRKRDVLVETRVTGTGTLR